MTINVFMGYDERESIAYHVATQSIIENTKDVVNITPLNIHTLKELGVYDKPLDFKASNSFSYTRFLTPYLSSFLGISIYLDPDVIVKGDLSDLVEYVKKGEIFAPVYVAKHNYTPKLKAKYFGAKQYAYRRKNWSSIMVFRNSACQILTPEYINKASPATLHQMEWVNSTANDGVREVGEIPKEWNWLVDEYKHKEDAKLLHYTNGIPAIDGFSDSGHSDDWWEYYNRSQRCRV